MSACTLEYRVYMVIIKHVSWAKLIELQNIYFFYLLEDSVFIAINFLVPIPNNCD